MRSVDQQVVQWAMKQPPHFDGASAEDCFKQAWGHSRIECSLEDFKAALKRRGVMVNTVRGARGDEPALFRLYMPGSAIGQGYSPVAHSVSEA